MKLFTNSQISSIDSYTVEHEPILSVNLMERAVRKLFDWFKTKYNHSQHIYLFAGPGKNGGDGLALARMLIIDGYRVSLFLVHETDNIADETRINLDRLVVNPKASVVKVESYFDFPVIGAGDVVVDAIFGAGLSRPCSGISLDVVKFINSSIAEVVSIDVPTGFRGENNCGVDADGVVKASWTVTFQFPKISFLLSDLAECLGNWVVLDIGLHAGAIENEESDFYYFEAQDVAAVLKNRKPFSHKGTYGHVLLCAGSKGMIGAAVLASKGCVRAGVGLLTVHLPACGVDVMQSSLPEAIVSTDADSDSLSVIPDMSKFSVVAVGPGLGQKTVTQMFLRELLSVAGAKPMILDADALNIMSLNPEWWSLVPEMSIITPHPGEFDRLTEHHSNAWSRMMSAIDFAETHKVVVVLKGHNTLVASPDGTAFFNSSGNAGMASGGCGDVLTGILAALMAQGYQATDAALLGVYLHGLAGDIVLGRQSEESLIASDIVEEIGAAFKQIRSVISDI